VTKILGEIERLHEQRHNARHVIETNAAELNTVRRQVGRTTLNHAVQHSLLVQLIDMLGVASTRSRAPLQSASVVLCKSMLYETVRVSYKFLLRRFQHTLIRSLCNTAAIPTLLHLLNICRLHKLRLH
jgi:hypothetical protein